MLKFLIRKKKTIGLPPGTPIHIGEEQAGNIIFTFLQYNELEYNIWQSEQFEECPLLTDDKVTWVHITGVHNTEVITQVGECIQLHPLTVEDIVNCSHRPKIDFHDEYLFIIIKEIGLENYFLQSYQFSLVLGKNFLFTFGEKKSSFLSYIYERIEKKKGRISTSKEDYLTYALLDVIVDNYLTILDYFRNEIEELEEEVAINPTTSLTDKIYKYKTDLIFLRKSISPVRNIISLLLNEEENSFFNSNNIHYLKDINDHLVEILEAIDLFKEMLNSIHDIYLSSLSVKTNEIMKFLTSMATIFIPLTFIVGLYGMNFKNIPEIEWKWGYVYVWGVILATAGAIGYYFKRKKWW